MRTWRRVAIAGQLLGEPSDIITESESSTNQPENTMPDNNALGAPQEVSSDGRELWDWAIDLFAHIHRQHKARELTDKISRAKRVCGSCSNWMTRRCPRERPNNTTGRSEGPSMNARRCADHFALKPIDAKLIGEWEVELVALTGETPCP